MRILDLYCCAGGAGWGYNLAGFDVYGVDLEDQPNNPFPFVQGDALQVLRYLIAGVKIGFNTGDALEWLGLEDFDAIHASPPCQSYLNLGRVNKAQGRTYEHPDLIADTRELLEQTGLPWVIENVQDARRELRNPVRVCGTGLRLPLRRHRLFESNIPLEGVPCRHDLYTVPKYWTGWRPNGEHRLSTVVQVYGNAGGREHWAEAMGIDWMSPREMCEAIPPRFSEHVGRQLIAHLEELAA